MSDSHFFNKETLVEILLASVDKTLGEVDSSDVFSVAIDKPKITGIAGSVVEQSVLGFPADNEQRPDLDVDGVLVELKTTGMKRKLTNRTETFVAKEPASITAVSIGTIEDENFDDSAFWHKIAKMLFVFYEYESHMTVPAYYYRNFHLRGFSFFEFEGDDLEIIKSDWQKIHDFLSDIRDNCTDEQARERYPDLSTVINKETVYLDTAPKYPHSPRFRLRKRVVDLIIQDAFDGTRFRHTAPDLYALPDHYIGYADVIDKCRELTRFYRGMTIAQLISFFSIESKPDSKDIAEKIIVSMFGGGHHKISKIDMFVRFGIIAKSITLSRTGSRTEDTKLTGVSFNDLSEPFVIDAETGEPREKVFEDSELYYYLNDHKFLFIVFQEPSTEAPLADNTFVGFKLLDLSYDELMHEAERCWTKARWLIQNDKLRICPILDKNGNQRYTPKTHLPMAAPNLPKSADFDVFFRGTGSDAAHKQIINGLEMYRQDYWVKGAALIDKLNTEEIIPV